MSCACLDGSLAAPWSQRPTERRREAENRDAALAAGILPVINSISAVERLIVHAHPSNCQQLQVMSLSIAPGTRTCCLLSVVTVRFAHGMRSAGPTRACNGPAFGRP